MIFIGPFCMLPAGATVMLLATGDGVPLGRGEAHAVAVLSDDGADAFDVDPAAPEPPEDEPLPEPEALVAAE
jgi:hypothetical protein